MTPAAEEPKVINLDPGSIQSARHRLHFPGSNLTTITGLIVLFILIFVSAYFQVTALEIFLILLFILCLLSFLWASASLRNIEVDLEKADCRAFPGETMELRAHLYNRKVLPLIWLDVDIPARPDSCIAPIETAANEDPEDVPGIGERFVWVMPHQKLEWIQRVHAARRGVFTAEGLSLSSGDGFGLTISNRTVPLPVPMRFIVYPKIVPVDSVLLEQQAREMEKSRKGFYTDPTLIRSTRDYQPGDNFKDINWRMLARTGELMTNIREHVRPRRICFFLDLESFAHKVTVRMQNEKQAVWKTREKELERAISVIASLCIRLKEQDILSCLVLPAILPFPKEGASDQIHQVLDRSYFTEKVESRIIIPEDMDSVIPDLLTALAETEYHGEPTELPVGEMEEQRHLLGQIVLYAHSVTGLTAQRLSILEDFTPTGILQDVTDEDTVFLRHTFAERNFTPDQ